MKSAEEIMNILEAYDLTGSLRDAGAGAGLWLAEAAVNRQAERRVK